LPEPGDSQKQIVNLTVAFPCYFPDRITIQRGVPVQFNVGAVGEPGCGRALVFQGLGVSKLISPSRITTFEFTPEKAGSYSITCTMHMMKAARLEVVD
jgi:plastocyanin domain-containing protein